MFLKQEVLQKGGLQRIGASEEVCGAGDEKAVAEPAAAFASRAVQEDIHRVLTEGLNGGLID